MNFNLPSVDVCFTVKLWWMWIWFRKIKFKKLQEFFLTAFCDICDINRIEKISLVFSQRQFPVPRVKSSEIFGLTGKQNKLNILLNLYDASTKETLQISVNFFLLNFNGNPIKLGTGSKNKKCLKQILIDFSGSFKFTFY